MRYQIFECVSGIVGSGIATFPSLWKLTEVTALPLVYTTRKLPMEHLYIAVPWYNNKFSRTKII